MRQMTRRDLVASAMASGIASCARPMPRRPRDSSGVTVLYPTDPEMQGNFLVFEPLVVSNSRFDYESRLAESWQFSPDRSVCTIHVRDGIRWHDSAPVTAEDVKFSVDLLQHPDVLWSAPGSYTVEVLNRLTCTITYHPHVAGITQLGPLSPATALWPKHLLENLDPKRFNDWNFWWQPVGCGPYRHLRSVRGAMMEFEANPDYYRGRPSIQRVVLRFGSGNVVPELLSGNVDLVEYQRSSDTLRLSRDPRFRIYQQEWPSGQALWWNLRHFLFRDPVVRRALTLAIDRRELLRLLNLPEEMHPRDFLSTVRQQLRGGFPEAIRYDPALARHFLDQTGWRLPPGKKVRERDGKPFRFNILVLMDADNVEAAVYVQDQLRRVGVAMEITTLSDFSLVNARIRSAEFEAAMFVLAGNAESLLPAIGYDDPPLFDLFKKSKTILNADSDILVEDYRQIIREENVVFQRDLPATLLYPFTWTTIAHSRIRGLEQRRYRWDLAQCISDLWLEDAA